MFYSDRTEGRSDVRPAEPAGPNTAGFLDPVYLIAALWRARLFVLLLGVLGCLAGAFYAASIPKSYTAIAQLVIDPRDLNLVQNDVTTSPTGMATDSALALIESQIAVMTSNTVLGQVVAQAELTADPEFNGTRLANPLVALVPSLGALLGDDDPEEAIRSRELLTVANLREHVEAARTANSFVINLAVKSEDPDKAAHLANLVAETFITEEGRIQADTARRATTALTARLTELRQKVGEAEEAVERYKADNKLVGVGGRLIDDEYITRINTQLAEVRAQITTLKVRADSMRRASVDDVVKGSFPEELNAESLLRLRQTYAEVAQNQAVLAARLGPRHPERQASDEALANARRAIQTELSRIIASAQTELARAEAAEKDLTSQLDQLRSRQIETSGAFVRLRELEREVDASRAVYEAYLLRARQLSEQEGLNTSNIRVISDATSPLTSSGMSRKLIAVAGGVVGIGLGLGLAGLFALIRLFSAGPGSAALAAPMVPARGAVSYRASALNHPANRLPMSEPAPGSAAASLDTEGTARPADAASASVENRGAFGDWSLRGANAAAETASLPAQQDSDATGIPGEQATPDTSEMEAAALSVEERRERLRERIRSIGERRRPVRSEPSSEIAADSEPSEAGDPSAARRRIELALEAARQRRKDSPINRP